MNGSDDTGGRKAEIEVALLWTSGRNVQNLFDVES